MASSVMWSTLEGSGWKGSVRYGSTNCPSPYGADVQQAGTDYSLGTFISLITEGLASSRKVS